MPEIKGDEMGDAALVPRKLCGDTHFTDEDTEAWERFNHAKNKGETKIFTPSEVWALCLSLCSFS